MQHLKTLQKQEKFLNEQTKSSIISPINNENKNVNLSPDMEIIKIATVVEAIRRKGQNNEQMLEVAKNIQKIIGKKRLKRSSYEMGNNATVTKNLQHTQQKNMLIANKKPRYPKPNYRKQIKIPIEEQLQNKNKVDSKTANNVAIPSTVFYKRIWEYINGTRPHSDIITAYDSLENNSEKTNSTCINRDRTSQTQNNKSQVTDSDFKPERDFYKRIWDIINATKSNENAKFRSKRSVNISKTNIASSLCNRQQTVNYEKEKLVQAASEKTSFGISDTRNSPGISNSIPYISGFWTVANETRRQPKNIPIINLAKLNNNPISSLIYSASEVDDLNKSPDKPERITLDNSTRYDNEERNLSQEIINEPGPPYSSEESFATLSFSSTESIVDKNSQEKEHAENYSSNTTPGYNPLDIPYVEVPEYFDQEDHLSNSNQNATATDHKEYDDIDYDYSPKRVHVADDFSSKSRSAEIKAQAVSNEPETSLNANNSRSSCIESKDSTECVDYNVEDTKLRNNTKDITDDDVHRSAEESTKSELEENKNLDFVDFDINEYKKPFNWEEFFKDDPILESIRASFKKKYDYKNNPDSIEETKEIETNPKEKSHNYFVRNEDFYEDNREIDLDDKNKMNKEIDFYTQKKTEESERNDKNYYPYDNKNFFKHVLKKNYDKELDYNHRENPNDTGESVEVEKDFKDDEENSDRAKESEEAETYATNPEQQSQDYFAKNEDYRNNHRIVGNRDEINDSEEEKKSYRKKETRESEKITKDPYDDDFIKHIFENGDKKVSDTVDTENEFLSHHFTKDVLHQLRDNSTIEEDKRRKESRNREDIHKTLSRILDKKDSFSRLDENLNKMIEKGEAIPIKYNNFWSLEYESPRKKNVNNEESEEEA